MNPTRRAVLCATGALALVLLLVSCTTVNKLATSDFDGATLAADMQSPPEPRLDIRYDVTLDRNNPIYSAFSVMTNIAKAGQAQKAESAMREALSSVDVPDVILEEAYAACASTLQTQLEERKLRADYLLLLEIHEWGIEASSPGSPVMLHIRLTANLYRTFGGELVWRRDLIVDDPASSDMFPIEGIVGDMVTATVLSSMTAEELAYGFTELARRSARSVSRLLERDLYSARYGR